MTGCVYPGEVAEGVTVAVIDAEFADFVRANERALLRLGWLLMADQHAAEDLLVATVTTPASVIDGDPAKVTMTVTNKGSVTTRGGSFTVVNAYALVAGQGTGFEFSGYPPSCTSVSGGLRCDVGALKPDQSAQFWQAITATGPADQIVFDVKWTNNAGVSTTFHRVVQVRAGVPSSELSSPPSSELPTPPASSLPPVSNSPSASSS